MGDGACHVARHSRFPPASPLHRHDFAEVFWVDEGSAIHEVNDTTTWVATGDLVLVRPDDVHRFRSPSAGFTITNVAFRRTVLTDLRRRYYEGRDFPWDAGPAATVRTTALQMARLAEVGASLAAGTPNRMQLDRFLLEVLEGTSAAIPTFTGAPAWLGEALAAWREDANAMAAGVGGLAALAGRSREHVSRVVKHSTGLRAIDLLNGLRADAAAARLRMTDEAIARIAVDVGLANLSHFYRVFGRRFGTTPRRYRLEHRTVVVPGVGAPR